MAIEHLLSVIVEDRPPVVAKQLKDLMLPPTAVNFFEYHPLLSTAGNHLLPMVTTNFTYLPLSSVATNHL